MGIGPSEQPRGHARSGTPRGRDRPRQHQIDTGWTAKQADALCNCAQDNGWPHPMRIADLLKLSDTDLHYMPQPPARCGSSAKHGKWRSKSDDL